MEETKEKTTVTGGEREKHTRLQAYSQERQRRVLGTALGGRFRIRVYPVSTQSHFFLSSEENFDKYEDTGDNVDVELVLPTYKPKYKATSGDR